MLPHFGHFTSVGKSPFFFEKCSPHSWQMYGMGVLGCGGNYRIGFWEHIHLLENLINYHRHLLHHFYAIIQLYTDFLYHEQWKAVFRHNHFSKFPLGRL